MAGYGRGRFSACMHEQRPKTPRSTRWPSETTIETDRRTPNTRLIGWEGAKCLVLLPSLPKSRFVRPATRCKIGDTIYFLCFFLVVVVKREAASCKHSNGRSQPAPFSNSLPLHARLATARVNTGNPKPLVASYQRHFKPRGRPQLDRVCCFFQTNDIGEAGLSASPASTSLDLLPTNVGS